MGGLRQLYLCRCCAVISDESTFSPPPPVGAEVNFLMQHVSASQKHAYRCDRAGKQLLLLLLLQRGVRWVGGGGATKKKHQRRAASQGIKDVTQAGEI